MQAEVSPRKLISVVTPCYNEQDNVEECYQTIRRIFEAELPGYDREHIFCDNASTDRTAEILRSIAAGDPSVRVILNARNFGPFCSLFNGILSTRGEGVLAFLAADLQDPPELLPQFVGLWEQGYKVVYGIRKKREESRTMRAIRKVYYRIVSRLANVSIPVDVGEFQFVDRAVIQALRGYDDYYPYIRGMIANCGFPATGVEFTWRARKRGFSKNRLYNLIDQGLNGLISFTNIPMRLCMFAGFSIAAASFVYAIVTFVVNLIFFRSFAAPGIPTLITALFFFSGLQLFFFGVIGEYISAIHFQVRKRPLVVELGRINFDERGLRRDESALTTVPPPPDARGPGERPGGAT